MKKSYLWTICITLVAFIVYVGYMYNPFNNVIKENKVKKEDTALSIVTFGERIESSKIYFIQWESLNSEKKNDVIEENDIFMFSTEEFQKNKHENLINNLIKDKKTVLFYGYRMNVKNILEDKNNIFPFYEIKSTQQIYFYLYGYGYSEFQKTMLPITIMGNFPKEKVGQHISNYLIKTYGNNK